MQVAGGSLYKARTGAISVPIEDLIINKTRTRQSSNYFIPYSSVNSHLHSFFPSTIRLWNSISPDIKSSASVESFKGSIGKIITKPSASPPLCLTTDNKGGSLDFRRGVPEDMCLSVRVNSRS